MEYGTNQWFRVSSLLPSKSPKQCKAHWFDWLDPSIIKSSASEWTRAEDEKLLHLVKMMPSQWRTTAPMVGGRTPIECYDRYEKLLDRCVLKIPRDSDNKSRTREIDPSPKSDLPGPNPVGVAGQVERRLVTNVGSPRTGSLVLVQQV